MQVIQTSVIENTVYYTTQYRGIEYYCYQTSHGEWCVHSRRLSLGNYNIGSFRHYQDLRLLAQSVKAFRALPDLISTPVKVLH